MTNANVFSHHVHKSSGASVSDSEINDNKSKKKGRKINIKNTNDLSSKNNKTVSQLCTN